jgi:hypothetical protein
MVAHANNARAQTAAKIITIARRVCNVYWINNAQIILEQQAS